MECKRITVALSTPNPLFKKWLQEWIDEAESKKRKISKTYQKALDSLNKYPLTLFNGHDCAILENFGPKICQLLDEKLEAHLRTQSDINSRLCYKDKIAELQRREVVKVSDLVRSVEAACLTDISFDLTDINASEEVSFRLDLSTAVRDEEQENICPDVEIPDELLSSSAESCDEEGSEDSIDRLMNKYNPEGAKKRRKVKRNENVIKRHKKTVVEQDKNNGIIDLSLSPQQSPIHTDCSPISTAVGGSRLKKFKTFDSNRRQLAGPSHASSPISKFLDVQTCHTSPASPIPRHEDDELDRLAAKYALPLPTVPKANEKPTAGIAKKPTMTKISGKTRLKAISEIPVTLSALTQQNSHPKGTQLIPDEEGEDEIKYIAIDEINPQDFDVVLLVDIQETSGKSKASTDDTLKQLRDSNVRNEVRKLNVGDFLWVAQHKTIKSKEFVLPYVVERKRLDDLSSSIKDGRYIEQKFRLKQCGIDNVIYLIENHMKNGKVQCGLPFTTLLQAATNTQIHSKFQVKFTESNQHTILYLTVMTSFIENIFKNKAPIKFRMIEFNKFNQAAVKQRRCTVRETFIKQLLALKGLSVDIALEVTKHYATPSDLYEKYRSLSQSEGEKLLNLITIGELKRKIPIAISKTIYQFYMCTKT